MIRPFSSLLQTKRYSICYWSVLVLSSPWSMSYCLCVSLLTCNHAIANVKYFVCSFLSFAMICFWRLLSFFVVYEFHFLLRSYRVSCMLLFHAKGRLSSFDCVLLLFLKNTFCLVLSYIFWTWHVVRWLPLIESDQHIYSDTNGYISFVQNTKIWHKAEKLDKAKVLILTILSLT